MFNVYLVFSGLGVGGGVGSLSDPDLKSLSRMIAAILAWLLSLDCDWSVEKNLCVLIGQYLVVSSNVQSCSTLDVPDVCVSSTVDEK